ncbi:hypothetical protein Vafri_9351 [Volvox africanus]|uniref:Uncharacterized protein n=1 Tax=Volvox africanus TaxID=51714 RepID=A0A8J4B458_9CHLO|nr:hypothetical protein Vafri_9351 [Volvox africanus]
MPWADPHLVQVAVQTRASGGEEPSSACKRQILADILVWAEVTQDHYDSGTQRFVTEPHEADESFQRIGRTFRALKATKGLGTSRTSLDAAESGSAGVLNMPAQPFGDGDSD